MRLLYYKESSLCPHMGRVNTPLFSPTQHRSLELGFKTVKSHCFLNRCHVILLKSQGLTSKEVGEITSMSTVRVNSWVHKYKEAGIKS
ncbi:hypothetical protein EZS27_021580 [termite gut metagenome]|uniref:Uncharacterized protein n=1 Tax=termite gut metagenome TaxID=433724 RepID=A0A5J4R979_9ZZZZ